MFFASLLLRFVSELQVSRRCWGLVAVDAWCVRWRERMQCCLVHEKSWNNVGVGEIRSHVFVPDSDYATRKRKNQLVAGLWSCHAWYAGFLNVNACPCCLLLSVMWHGFSRLFVSSLLAALFEGQWSALPTSAHS